jgi:hypothetical protein
MSDLLDEVLEQGLVKIRQRGSITQLVVRTSRQLLNRQVISSLGDRGRSTGDGGSGGEARAPPMIASLG